MKDDAESRIERLCVDFDMVLSIGTYCDDGRTKFSVLIDRQVDIDEFFEKEFLGETIGEAVSQAVEFLEEDR